jgi:uracil-DNA glycosylase
MQRPSVSGGAVVSKVMLIGQAPGTREPIMGRPFAWTAGRTLFRWFEEATGLTEEQFRSSIYMAAVARCFPGKRPEGGDRVPDKMEISACSDWLSAELNILRPELVIPVGKLAIEQFLAAAPLEAVIGRQFRTNREGIQFDLIPLPHPSGASPWPRVEPGRTLTQQALRLTAAHPAMRKICERFR